MKTETENKMHTLREAFGRDSAYWGERSDWLIAYTTNLDADCLGRSNWRSFIKALGGSGGEGAKGTQDVSETVAIEEAKHWACGWVQYLIVHPDAKEQIAIAEAIIEKLDGYPVVDEDDWSQLERDEYDKFFERDAQSEFRRQLKDILCDAALDAVESAPIGVLLEWFEAQIPSGEYQSDGYPNFSLAFDRVTREELAKLLRVIRASKTASA